MERCSDDGGFTLAEVLIAIAILVIGLVALMATLSRGTLNVSYGGGQTKATEYARQKVEELRNQPVTAPCFAVDCINITDPPLQPEPGITRTWTVLLCSPAGVCPGGPGATVAPNRLWSITVTVRVNQSSQVAGGQSITLQTMRAE